MDKYLAELKIYAGAIVLFGFIALIICIIVYFIIRHINKSKSRYIFILMIGVIVTTISLSAIVLWDIKDKSICIDENARYVRKETYNNYVEVYFSDGTMQVFRLFSNENMQFGEYEGTVIYAEHSWILLDFQVDKKLQ